MLECNILANDANESSQTNSFDALIVLQKRYITALARASKAYPSALE
jgi:hypothetical protein